MTWVTLSFRAPPELEGREIRGGGGGGGCLSWVTAQGVELVTGASLEAPQQSSQLETLASISGVVTMTSIQPVRQAFLAWLHWELWWLDLEGSGTNHCDEKSFWQREWGLVLYKHRWSNKNHFQLAYVSVCWQLDNELLCKYHQLDSVGSIGCLPTWLVFMITSISHSAPKLHHNQSLENQFREKSGSHRAILYCLRCMQGETILLNRDHERVHDRAVEFKYITVTGPAPRPCNESWGRKLWR